MKINILILYSALRNPVKFKKNLVVRSRAIIFQSWVKIYRLLWQRVELYSVLIQKEKKLYALKGLSWKTRILYSLSSKSYTHGLEMFLLVGENFFWVKVTKSRNLTFKYGNVEVINAADISNRSERETLQWG